MMSERKQAIEAYMREAHRATWPVLAGIPEAGRATLVYGEGGPWTVRDVVAHLADAETGLLGQVQRLLAGKETVPPDFDLNRWNRGAVRRSQSRPFEALVEEIQKSHDAALQTLQNCPEQDLDRRGRHSSGEILSAEGFLRRMADHRREHTRDIQQALASAASAPAPGTE
jgi:hypothetical protein